MLYHIHFLFFSVPSVAPPNLHATSVFDSSIDIAWQDPSLSPILWEVFQGYKIFIRPLGSAEVNIVTINAQQNFATLPGLKSLVTYNISVAAYTFAGVGRQSESISVTTTLGKAACKSNRLKTDGILFTEHLFFLVCESMIGNGDWCNYNATNGICATSQRHH